MEALPIALSMPLDIDEEVLIENEASWHQSCHLQFSTSNLNKAKERLARKREQDQKSWTFRVRDKLSAASLFKMADKNNRSQEKRFPYDILNNLSSLDLFYEVYIP